MKHSPYITWAKKHHDIKYNLAGSGMPAKPLAELVDDPREILQSGVHEDGWQPLMDRIARRYEVNPEQVVLTSSASMANHLIFALLLEPNADILVETPAYEPLVSVPKYLNANVLSFDRSPVNSYQPDPAEIQGLITDKTRLITLTDMHNPSGAKLDEEVLRAIIEIAEEYDIYLLIDEVYLEFLYPEGQHTAAGLSDKIITCRSLTKAFGLDDVRIGWIIAESGLAERLQRLKDLFSTTLPFPSERLGKAALDQADMMLEKNLRLLETNFEIVHKFVQNEPRLSWIAPPAGSVGFIKLNDGNTKQLVQKAKEKYQTVVVPGHFFAHPGYFRMGWGISTNELKQGLNFLGKTIALI